LFILNVAYTRRPPHENQKGEPLEVNMERHVSKRFLLFLSVALVSALVLTFWGVLIAQEIPGLPKLPGGFKTPSMPGAATGFAGLDALNAAKELTAQKDKTSYPTPNIGVSGSNVIAWPNGVVTIETIADDGTLKRTVLGPPSEKNVPSGGKYQILGATYFRHQQKIAGGQQQSVAEVPNDQR
jgi:hypothetical protein